jgi:hypothetical protein
LYNEIILGKDTIKTLESLKRKIDDIEAEELDFYAKQKKDVKIMLFRILK